MEFAAHLFFWCNPSTSPSPLAQEIVSSILLVLYWPQPHFNFNCSLRNWQFLFGINTFLFYLQEFLIYLCVSYFSRDMPQNIGKSLSGGMV